MTTQNIATTNAMTERTQEQISEARYWYPQYDVHLLHGFPATGGVIVETIRVTKDWERVVSAMIKLSEKAKTLPQHERGEWYITVDEMAAISTGTFPLQYSEQYKDL